MEQEVWLEGEPTAFPQSGLSSLGLHHRTAVVLRSWIDKQYTEDDIHFVRSMVTELSLMSGAEYEVILLVDAKDTQLPNATDTAGMKDFKAQYLPVELQDLAVFFNEDVLAEWYPKIEVHM